jgi:hypothetical protein
MTTLRKRSLQLGALLGMAVMAAALLRAQTQAPEAGSIATMVPVAEVTRPGTPAPLEARKGMTVFWNDKVTTQRGGRVRIRLGDGSVLNVGSASQLVIAKHDANEQNTEIDLLYGKLRSNATRIVRPSGQFKVRTRAATAGVVGTEKYLEASDISTTVIALGGGDVVVTSSDARFPQPVVLSPGETVRMDVGRPPEPKRTATPEELSRAVAETESDPLVQLSPSQATPGSRIEATITGRGLDSARGYSASQPGIQVISRGTPSATSIPVTITVGADVPPGTYTVTIDRPSGPATGTLVVLARETPVAAGGSGIVLPATLGASSALRGAKLSFDASSVLAPPGTQIVRYEWRVLNTQLRSNDAVFALNTSLLNPGSYTVELTVTNDRGQTATQRYPLAVQAGTTPAEILQALAMAYESLQPTSFLRYFDEQRFRNFAGFAGAIEDSFRNQLETMRVFQRAVNCQVSEEQDQAICQADFELQFTKKDQPLQLLDPQGNPVPAGATAPPGSRLGKAVQTGFERNTLRFERADQGWRIVDYGAVVSCPGGGSTSGVSVGSCVLAVGTAATPTFQLINLQLSSSSLSLGGTANGSVEVQSIGGYTGQVNLTGQAQVGNQPITVQFARNPVSPGQVTSFTITAPTSAPTGFTGPANFTLVITGQDTSGGLTASVNATMTLLPDYTLSVTPATTSGAPLSVTHNSTSNINVTISAGPGFAGTVFVDFPNLPAGFQISPGNVPAGSTVAFPMTVTAGASPGPALITVRSASSANVVRTAAVFAVVTSDFTLTATSATGFVGSPGGTIPVTVNVVPISGFAGSVLVDFIGLATGITAAPPNATVPAGGSASFTLAIGAAVPLGAINFTIRGTFLSTVRTLAVSGTVQSAPPMVTQGPPPAASATKSSAPAKSTTTTTTSGSTDPLATNPFATQPSGAATGTTPAKPAGPAAPTGTSPGAPRIERARLRLQTGGCTAFRFASASEQRCGGAADMELHVATHGEITLEAEGVAAVGTVALDQYRAPATTLSFSRSVPVLTGSTYVVQVKNTLVAVRITAGRQIGGRAGPRRAQEPGEDSGAQGLLVLVNLEWRVLP